MLSQFNSLSASKGKPVLPIVMQGEFYRDDTGPFKVDDKAFNQIIDNAKDRGLPLTVDLDHCMSGPSFGLIQPDSFFTIDYKPSESAKPVKVLCGLVDWQLPKDTIEEAIKTRPFISPVMMFDAARLMTTSKGKAGDPIGFFVERVSLVDSPFFPMPKVSHMNGYDFNSGAKVSSRGYLFELDPTKKKDAVKEALDSAQQNITKFQLETMTNNLISGLTKRFSNMSDELRKAIADILNSDKTPEEKGNDIANLMGSYSKSHVERYETTYVKTWSILANKFGFDASLISADPIISAYDSAVSEAKEKSTAFNTLEQKLAESNLKKTGELVASAAAASNSVDFKALYESKQAELDAQIFSHNAELKKHSAAGWDQETAELVFKHNRAKYDAKMKDQKPAAFTELPKAAPLMDSQITTPQFSGLNKNQALAAFAAQYTAEQVAKGRSYDMALLNEAMQAADNAYMQAASNATKSALS
jgi:hypothetical protein